MAPPSSSASHPGRHLAVLAGVIVVLLLVILGGNLISPANWHKDFKVKLGLDLTSGTEITLSAVTPKHKPANKAQMDEAIAIMQDRVNGAGFTEAQVQPQGNNIINVSIPGQENQKVENLVSQSAELSFRRVLLEIPNSATPTPTPTPSPTPSGAPSGAPSPGVSSPPSPSPSTSTKAAGLSGSAGRGSLREMAVGASRVRNAQAAPAATPSPSASASAPATSPAPTPTPSSPTTAPPSSSAGTYCGPTPKNLAPAKGTATWQEAQTNSLLGVPDQLCGQVKALFNHINCTGKSWPDQAGYTQLQLNSTLNKDAVVSCGLVQGIMYKFALGPVVVNGDQVSGASAAIIPSSASQWQVNVNFRPKGAAEFGAVTTEIYNKYHCSANAACPANGQLAAVLDGTVINSPGIDGAITGGAAQITPFTQQAAATLQQQLAYGALPLTFTRQSIQTVSPQLGHDQLNAGLIAGGIGLILVICYLVFYYRGLAAVSVSSLVIAGLLTYLAVVSLGKYAGFAMNLAGIAGLIVAIGITADSFVVFFERLRDEVREGGRSLRAAVERGWTRARRTILVSDTVSFIAAALLYYFSIGDVKGFAFTLGMITIIDIVVVFMFTKPMVTLLARTKFFGGGHPWSGLDPSRLGARAPWRGTPRSGAPRSVRPSPARASRPGPAKEA